MKKTTGLKDGVIVLGLDAEVGGTRVTIQPGACGSKLPTVEVSSEEEALEYVDVARALKYVNKFNWVAATARCMSEEDAIEAMGRMVEWCEEPLQVTRRFGYFVHLALPVNMGGILLDMGATPQNDGVLFEISGGHYRDWLEEERIEEEGSNIFKHASEKLERTICDSWGGAAIISGNTHDTVLSTFDPSIVPEETLTSKVPHRPLPRGWISYHFPG